MILKISSFSYVASALLTLAMVLGLMPGLGATALAEIWEGNPYADFVGKTTTVTFNGKPWNVIADNSEAIDKGSLTLLAADTSFGTSEFSSNYRNNYIDSTIKATPDQMTEEGGSFADVAGAIADTDYGKLYLLSTEEAQALKQSSQDVLKMNFTGGNCSSGEWWLRSPGTDSRGDAAAFVGGEIGIVDEFGSPVG